MKKEYAFTLDEVGSILLQHLLYAGELSPGGYDAWIHIRRPQGALSSLTVSVEPRAEGQIIVGAGEGASWRDLSCCWCQLPLPTASVASDIAGAPEFLHHPRAFFGVAQREDGDAGVLLCCSVECARHFAGAEGPLSESPLAEAPLSESLPPEAP